MITKTACAVLIASLALAAPAAAQFGPPRLGDDTPTVSELIVPAYGGPQWWKVSDKDTTVYILADPGLLPPGVTFDQALLEKRLTGATSVITRSAMVLKTRITSGPVAISALDPSFNRLRVLPEIDALLKLMNGARKPVLEPTLPADVRERFVTWRNAIRQPENRYGALPVGLAGMALAGDAIWIAQGGAIHLPAEGTTYATDIVAKEAKARGLTAAPAKTYGEAEMRMFFQELRQQDLKCMTASLNELDASRPTAPTAAQSRAVAQAWADGDVRPLLQEAQRQAATSTTLDLVYPEAGLHLLLSPTCLKAMPGVTRITEQWTAEEAKAVVRQLRRPGHAVAILDAVSLLAKGGVLDLLRQQGYTVKAPDVD